MKRALFALTLSLAFLVPSVAQAQRLDPTAPLKAYAAKVLPRCPAGVLTVEPLGAGGPANFTAYVLTQRSSDEYCGSQKYLLYSPKSQQVVIGSIVQLPNDSRPAAARITEQATQLLGHQVKATVAPFPLGDGLKAVTVSRNTPFGSFGYQALLDQSEQFMIVGMRGSLLTDPSKTLHEALNASTAARRGNASSKTEVLEISDFQCPTCAAAHLKVEPLIRQNLSKINYVRIDLPLFEHHEWAMQAAMGARALQRVAPAKYWDYVDYVFKNQEQVGKRGNFDQVLKEWCEDNDVNFAAVQKIYASKQERQALLDQVSRAFALGIASTPTYVINGQILGFGPDGSFTIDQIKKALGSSSAPAAKKSTK